MKYKRHRKIWDRWDIEYFNKLYRKLQQRRKSNGYPLYTSKEEVFDDLNQAYYNVYGKERFSSYESFIAAYSQFKSRMKTK